MWLITRPGVTWQLHHRLLEKHKKSTFFLGRAGTELYDEQKDKGEITNLAKQPGFAALIKSMSTQLHKTYDPSTVHIPCNGNNKSE